MPISSIPTAHHSSYHIWLVDGDGRGLGLKLVNSSGEVTSTGVKRQSYPRSTLRVNSGEGKWNDLQPPYGQIVKSDFTGGMGSKDLEADSTKYFFCQ